MSSECEVVFARIVSAEPVVVVDDVIEVKHSSHQKVENIREKGGRKPYSAVEGAVFRPFRPTRGRYAASPARAGGDLNSCVKCVWCEICGCSGELQISDIEWRSPDEKCYAAPVLAGATSRDPEVVV